MTTNAFVKAQKQLVRILARHMIQVTERAHVLDSKKASGLIFENVCGRWNGEATFEWDIV